MTTPKKLAERHYAPLVSLFATLADDSTKNRQRYALEALMFGASVDPERMANALTRAAKRVRREPFAAGAIPNETAAKIVRLSDRRRPVSGAA
ncbi:MAG TPA: hypothetical protein VL048_05835 [Xanthobacteraceae bacterium]|nr:hypothetical protein [Xanthobacteraceae bacterium]